MRPPLDDVSPAPSLSVENASLRVLLFASIILLLLVLAYLFFLPNRLVERYSTLEWGSLPSFVSEMNSPLQRGQILFSIQLSSFEENDTSYRINVEYEGRTVATKNVSLLPQNTQTVDFSIPVQGTLDSQNQIRVVVTKPSLDSNKTKDDGLLELVGYFPRP